MSRRAHWFTVGEWFDWVRPLVAYAPILNRRRWALSVAAAVVSSIPPPEIPCECHTRSCDRRAERFAQTGHCESIPAGTCPGADWQGRAADDRPISSLCVRPDCRLIAVADDNSPSPQIAIFDVQSGRRVRKLITPGNQQGWIGSVAFSPDGTKLFWGENGGEVALWDLEGDRLLFRAKVHHGPVSDVKFSPDGDMIASAGAISSAYNESPSRRTLCKASRRGPTSRPTHRKLPTPSSRNTAPLKASRAWHSHPMGPGSWRETTVMPRSSSGTSGTAGWCGRSKTSMAISGRIQSIPACITLR